MLPPTPTLQGNHLRLEPLTLAHAAELFACADREQFRYFLHWPQTWDVTGFEGFVSHLLATPQMQSLVMRLPTGEVVGSSSFMDIREPHRGLEIGCTWIATAQRGTAVNPAAKRLMLAHAFETLGMVRVQLKCDGRNLHSQAAIAKLGAVREGVLRRHMVCPDGFVRDTVMFSMTDLEWPGVRARLDERLTAIA